MAIYGPRFNSLYGWHIVMHSVDGTMTIKCISSPLAYYKRMNVKPPVGASSDESHYQNIDNIESDEDVAKLPNAPPVQIVDNVFMFPFASTSNVFGTLPASMSNSTLDIDDPLGLTDYLFSPFAFSNPSGISIGSTSQMAQNSAGASSLATEYLDTGISSSYLFPSSITPSYPKQQLDAKIQSLKNKLSDLSSQNNFNYLSQPGTGVSSAYNQAPFTVIKKMKEIESLSQPENYYPSPTFDFLASHGLLPKKKKSGSSKSKKSASLSHSGNNHSSSSSLHSVYSIIPKAKHQGSSKSKIKIAASSQSTTSNIEVPQQNIPSTCNLDSDDVLMMDYSELDDSEVVTHYDIPYIKSKSDDPKPEE